MCKIGVIDSGLGGISTLAALMGVLPREEYVYAADKSHMPYGDREPSFIARRISEICAVLRAEGAKAIVIACNTATGAGIAGLREADPKTIYVGVEPAIKPAFEELTCGKALILLTPLTAAQPKFERLLASFDQSCFIVSPQPQLASLIEQNICNLPLIKGEIKKILGNYAQENIESIVLGCTHYCLVQNYIAQFSGAKIYDGNTGTALRLYSLLKQRNLISRTGSGGVKFLTL